MGCWGVLSSPIGCNLQNWSNFTLWAARCNKGEREDLLEKGEEVHILITHQGGISFDIHPSLHEKEILPASEEHLQTIMYERGWYLRMPTITRILPTPTMKCTNAVITASAVKKWGQARAWIMESWWIDLQSLIVYQASYRLNLGKPKSNSHWSMLLHLTCFINLLISIWKNYPFHWSQKILPTVI